MEVLVNSHYQKYKYQAAGSSRAEEGRGDGNRDAGGCWRLQAAGDNLYSENINFRDVSHLQPSLHSLPPPSRAARGHALLMLKKFNDSNETTQVLRPSGFMLQVQVHPCLICFLQNILYL